MNDRSSCGITILKNKLLSHKSRCARSSTNLTLPLCRYPLRSIVTLNPSIRGNSALSGL
jgi:hypothetical protein